MAKERIALRISKDLADRIDEHARQDARTRSGWIIYALSLTLQASVEGCRKLQSPGDGQGRQKMLSFRLGAKQVSKLDTLAALDVCSRSEVVLRMLARAVEPGWRTELARLTPAARRAKPPPVPVENVFA